jgi:tetratricopeptide (TPR) repeat protein
MSFIKRLFEKLSALSSATSGKRLGLFPAAQTRDELAKTAVVDQARWRKSVLPSALEARWDDPERLSSLVVDGMRRGCEKALVGAAHRLTEIDEKPERAAHLEALVLLKAGRLDEAEVALKACMTKHGEDSRLLSHLARVYAERGDQIRAELTLWRALRLNPNQDDAVQWWAAIHRERFGQQGYIRSLEQVSAVPGSWRPQLWLARVALEENDYAKSRRYYRHVLSALRPIPADVIAQIAGDLANAGRYQDVVELVSNRFDAEAHGLIAGSSIIKAHLKLGQADKARAVLGSLRKLGRLDWNEHLDYWQDQLDKAPSSSQPAAEATESGTLVLEAPVWCHLLKDQASLLPSKGDTAPRFAFVTLSWREGASFEEGPDNHGTLSRVIPLFLAEQIHMLTTASGLMITPVGSDGEMASKGKAYSEDALLDMAQRIRADYLICGRLDVSASPWKVELTIRRVGSRTTQARIIAPVNPFSPGADILNLSRRLQGVVLEKCDVQRCIRPISYHIPTGESLDLFVEALSESLAMSAATAPGCGASMLYLERSILQYLLDLAIQEPRSDVAQLMFISALAKNKAYGSQVYNQFADKADKLLRDHPLTGYTALAARSTLSDLFPDFRFAEN